MWISGVAMKLNWFEQRVADGMPPVVSPLIVALSGGADSVALLAALSSIGMTCVAAHCNFHLRGAESDRDEQYVRDVCARLNVRLYVKHFDVESYRQSCRGSVSVEMACRDLRYEWFETLRLDLGADAVAVAHNADDNAETMLLNLMRGTGISGLRGMLPRTARHIVRPMLHIHRCDIERYLAELGLEFVTDSTNLINDYSRNKMRNLVMPVMRKCFANADIGIQHTLSVMAETDAFYRDAVAVRLQKYVVDENTLDLRRLVSEDVHARLLLYEWCSDKGLSSSVIDDILHCDSSGRRFPLSDGEYLLVDRGRLIHVEALKTYREWNFDEIFELSVASTDQFIPVRDACIAYFDESVLDGEPWQVRSWHEGDIIEPFGMHGRRKVSDLFTDAKVPVSKKHAIPLLVKNGRILWVAGIRASRYFPVTERTERFVTLRYRKK